MISKHVLFQWEKHGMTNQFKVKLKKTTLIYELSSVQHKMFYYQVFIFYLLQMKCLAVTQYVTVAEMQYQHFILFIY